MHCMRPSVVEIRPRQGMLELSSAFPDDFEAKEALC